jgi:NAD(P)-dependent dehydrogenase (short-subunit alcohol dehydrogenase family)
MTTAKQTVIVTGGNTGLGFKAARAIAESDQGGTLLSPAATPSRHPRPSERSRAGRPKAGSRRCPSTCHLWHPFGHLLRITPDATSRRYEASS